jgi:CBS-domain-containing membrane protein
MTNAYVLVNITQLITLLAASVLIFFPGMTSGWINQPTSIVCGAFIALMILNTLIKCCYRGDDDESSNSKQQCSEC